MTDYQKKFVDDDALTTFEAIESRVKELVAAKKASEAESAATEETAEETAENTAEENV
jgi:ABC-type uncharacterized transport system fused permease/ATPase subunit